MSQFGDAGPETPWFSDGLRFTCTRCSRCCRHESGYVFLSDDDIQRFCSYFSVSREEFIQKFCTRVDLEFTQRISLKEQENFDCIFWKNGLCSVYEARPLQCQSYPFWTQNLNSDASWQSLEKECPGINIGDRHSLVDINKWLSRQKKNSFNF